MAKVDYYCCDICGKKTFYDANVDYEKFRVGFMVVFCPECSEKFRDEIEKFTKSIAVGSLFWDGSLIR